jgi:DNA-binding protein
MYQFPFFLETLPEFFENFFQQFLWEIIFLIILAILGGVYYFGRGRIKKRLFLRKVKPKVQKTMNVYAKDILPEFIEATPKIKIVERKEDIPSQIPFGYLFIPEGQEEVIWSVLLAYIPVSCSLRRIRILFDESLRKSMFDLLSFKLGQKLGLEDIAVGFRDHALHQYPQDFQRMEHLFEDGKLTYIILSEASIRFRRTDGKISTSDVEEFSTLVRKLADIDAVVVRIGESDVEFYVNQTIEKKRGVVLLARGAYISKAVYVANRLREKNYELYSPETLGFENPEIGTWTFEFPKAKRTEFSFMRIWLKKPSQ